MRAASVPASAPPSPEPGEPLPWRPGVGAAPERRGTAEDTRTPGGAADPLRHPEHRCGEWERGRGPGVRGEAQRRRRGVGAGPGWAGKPWGPQPLWAGPRPPEHLSCLTVEGREAASIPQAEILPRPGPSPAPTPSTARLRAGPVGTAGLPWGMDTEQGHHYLPLVPR